MLLHVDSKKFVVKPTKGEIAGIKGRFTKAASIKDATVEQVAACLIAGRTIEPGVCPYSDASAEIDAKGTRKEDFTRQTIFLNDIDNKLPGVEIETPAHVADVLAAHNLKAAFMYETFNSKPENIRFRIALVSDTEITDKDERDRIQAALIALFPQADPDCKNADRIFFGTDKGLIEGYTDYSAVCAKADLLGLADELNIPERPDEITIAPKAEKAATAKATPAPKADKTKFGGTIPTGQRHTTLVRFASTILTKYGVCEKTREGFMQRAAQCAKPLPDNELQRIWRDACAYYDRVISKQPGYIQPSEYMTLDFENSYEPNDYTDVGQATLYAQIYGDIVKYTPATKFLVYNGQIWEESEIKAQRFSQDLTDKQLAEARGRVDVAQAALNAAVEGGDNEEIKEAHSNLKAQEAFRAFVLQRRKTDKIKATLTEVRPKVEINVSELDNDGELLNTPAGTINLKTGAIRPHDPKDYCTRITAVGPDSVNAELFAEFLNRLTMGDKDLERYLQEVAGMCAVGYVSNETLIIAFGPGGNGKSTFFNLLGMVLGDYSGSLSAEILTASCRKNKSPELADLRGKRIVLAAELEEGQRLDMGAVKQVCSVDVIKAEQKYKDPIEYKPSHTLILFTNHLPKVGSMDKGTWDRLVVVPFKANFRGVKGEIKNYGKYLFEYCGGAVLSWMIEGAKRFIANGCFLTQPECVKTSNAEYKANNNWLENFLYDCCETGSTYTQKSGELYEHYRKYCDNMGEYRRSLADFKQALSNAGYETRKTKTGAYVHGLRLTAEALGLIPNDEPTPWDNAPG